MTARELVRGILALWGFGILVTTAISLTLAWLFGFIE